MGSVAKKYDFKIDQFKSEVEFLNHIDRWYAYFNINFFVKKMAFKYFPKTILTLTHAFKTSIIQYAIIKRFPTLFQQVSQSYVLSLSEKIKQEYIGVNFSMMMNSDSFFYYLCVFMTKKIITYLMDTFIDIEIDRNLQSQLYIILVYAMIGLEVTTKNYQINHKKIVHEKKCNLNITVKSSSFSMSKLESFQMLSLQKLTGQRPFKEKKKFKVERHPTKLPQRQQLSCVEQFRDTLKENLYVKVLPKIPKKKIKAWEFDYLSDKAEAEKQGDEKKFIFIRQEPVIIKPSQEQILSHQTSSSYEYFMKKNNQTINFVNRNTKISYRPQYLMNSKGKNGESISQSLQSKVIKREELNAMSNRKNWNKIINEIRSNAMQTNKFKGTSSVEECFSSQRPSKVTSHRRSQTDKLDFPQRIGRQINMNEHGQLLCSSQGFNSISTEGPALSVGKVDVKEKNKLINLRKERGQFGQACEIRSFVSNYSVFNVNCSAGEAFRKHKFLVI